MKIKHKYSLNDRLDLLAYECIHGTFGDGRMRKFKLGHMYELVQERVNEIYKYKRSYNDKETYDVRKLYVDLKYWQLMLLQANSVDDNELADKINKQIKDIKNEIERLETIRSCKNG